MNLDIINTVLMVAHTHSFSTAAFLIPCAQSSVSRRVEAAESELNTRIFTRPSDTPDRSVSLTDVGKQIIPVMEKIVEDYRNLFYLAAGNDHQNSTIRIGIRNNMLPPMAFSIMKADFFELYPNISLELSFAGMDVLLSELNARRLDAVWFSCSSIDEKVIPMEKKLKIDFLGRVRLSIGVSVENPLAAYSDASLDMFRNELFLTNSVPTDNVPGINFADFGILSEIMKGQYGNEMRESILPWHMLEICYRIAQKNKGVFLSYTPECWRTLSGISFVRIKEIEHYVRYYLLSLKNNKDSEISVLSEYLQKNIAAESQN